LGGKKREDTTSFKKRLGLGEGEGEGRETHIEIEKGYFQLTRVYRVSPKKKKVPKGTETILGAS